MPVGAIANIDAVRATEQTGRRRPDIVRAMWKLISGALLAIVTMAGIYAAAATTASSVTATFNTTETASRARNVEFQSAAKRSSVEHEAAHAKCAILERKQIAACSREARANELRAFKAAQL